MTSCKVCRAPVVARIWVPGRQQFVELYDCSAAWRWGEDPAELQPCPQRPPARLADDEVHLAALLRTEDDARARLADAEQELARLRAELGEAAPAPWERAGHWALWRRSYGDDAEIVVWRVREGEAWWRAASADAREVTEAQAGSVIAAIHAADAWLAGRQ